MALVMRTPTLKVVMASGVGMSEQWLFCLLAAVVVGGCVATAESNVHRTASFPRRLASVVCMIAQEIEQPGHVKCTHCLTR